MFHPISTNFTSTLGIPLSSSVLEPGSFECSSEVEPRAFTSDLPGRLRALYAVIPNNASTLRLTAAAGTELAGAYSSGTVIIFPEKRALQP